MSAPAPGTRQGLPGTRSFPNLLAWAQQEGVNLITIKIAPPGSDKSYYAFKPLGMKVWRIENDRFENVQSELRRSKRLELPAPWEGLLAQIDEKTGAWDENLTVSFLFITNKGTCGAIQIQPPVSQEPASGPARKRAGVRYHFIYEEDAMNGALRAESQSATDVLPAAEVKPRDGSRIIARVGADAILESDLAVRINEYLEANKDRIPPGQLEETRKAQTRQRLKPLIETKLILQDAKRRIPAEGWSHVERQLSKHFEDVEQAKLMKKAGVGTPREFDQKLRALGTSLEREKRAFVERGAGPGVGPPADQARRRSHGEACGGGA